MALKLDTDPILRPTQLEAARDELSQLETKLHNPHIQDKGEVYRQIRGLEKTLERQSPKPLVGADVDAARRKAEELKDQWMVGMPSMEEMRKAPPGAVEKHMDWEKRNETAVAQWKNLMLRIHASEGDYSDGSVANIERHRPRESTLNMDNAQIVGKQFYLPSAGVAPAVPFSDEQLAVLELISPGLREKLALMTNSQRAEVKAALPKQAPVDDDPL